MVKRTMSGYAACLMTIVPMAAFTAASGCNGEPAGEDGDLVANETAGVTNKGAADPGPRGGVAGAGAPLAAQPVDSSNAKEQAKAASACFPGLLPGLPQLQPATKLFCEQAVIRFQEIDAVSGAGVSTGLTGFVAAGTTEDGTGLGPTFNANGCHVCHSQPGVLGAGVAPSSPQYPGVPNPQVQMATMDGMKNVVPSFITAEGPIREVRFKSDGGVHDLYTIAGRPDAVGCKASQPPFAAQLAAGNVSFRIPIAVFGDGLVENIPEMALEANLAKSSANKAFKTGGIFNRSGNDGTITRLGWKAQNKGALAFAMEAYNVEQGVSNMGFPNEREGGATNLQGCMALNPTPEDNTAFDGTGTPSDVSADVLNFAAAIQLSAPPAPTTVGIPTKLCGAVSCADAAVHGEEVFTDIGCASCHTKQLTTAASSFDPAMSNVTIAPFSDFAIHNMGTGLSDGVTQGNAGPQQFRTAPLWGVGQRLFFLHDGRTSDLTAAIAAHASHGSDANIVIGNFNYLSKSDQQALLVFLRSL